MKYAIKGGIFAGIMQLILFSLPILINIISSPKIPNVSSIAFIAYIICVLPSAIILFLTELLFATITFGNFSISSFFGTTDGWFELSNNGWIISSTVIILIGTLIGYIYGKIKGKRQNSNLQEMR